MSIKLNNKKMSRYMRFIYGGTLCFALVASLAFVPSGSAEEIPSYSRNRDGRTITGRAVPRDETDDSNLHSLNIKVNKDGGGSLMGVEVKLISDNPSNPANGQVGLTNIAGEIGFNVRTDGYTLQFRKVGYQDKDDRINVSGPHNYVTSLVERPGSTTPPPPSRTQDCGPIDQVLRGFISDVGDGGQARAQVTNSSNGCSYKVTFASYKMFILSGHGWIETQKLHDYQTLTVGPGTTHFSIRTPTSDNCRFQLDLIEGDVLQVPDYGGAGRYFIAVAFGGPNQSCSTPVHTPVDPIHHGRNITSVVPACPGQDAIVRGTNLDPTVQIIDANGHRFTLHDGNRINASKTEVVFRIPSDFHPGNYTLRVGPSLTDVSNTVAFVIPSCHTAVTHPNLTVAKTARNISTGSGESENASAQPAETIEFIIRVSPGPAPLHDVRLVDTLPSRMRYLNGSTTVNGTSREDGITGNAGIHLGNLPANDTVVVRFRVALDSESSFSSGSTTLTNVAHVSAAGVASVNDDARVTVNRSAINNATLSLNKLVRNISQSTGEQDSVNARANETVEFVIYVTAGGNQTAQNVRLSDTLPGGLRYINGSATVNGSGLSDAIVGSGVNLGSQYNTTSVVRFRAQVENESYFTFGSTTLTNTAFVSSDNAASHTDTARVIVQRDGGTTPQNTTLGITKTVRNITRGDTNQFSSVSAKNGDTVDFTITVRNNGSVNANNVVVHDTLPNGLTYSLNSTSLDGIATNEGLVNGSGLYIGNLAPGQQRVIRFFATVNAGVGSTIRNTAQSRADNAAQVSAEASVSVGAVAGAIDVKTGAGSVAASAALMGLLAAMVYYFGWDVRRWPLINKPQKEVVSGTHFDI